jgi:hypothetical protein
MANPGEGPVPGVHKAAGWPAWQARHLVIR